MIEYLIAGIVVLLIVTTVVIFLRLHLISLGIMLIALAGSIMSCAMGYRWLIDSVPEHTTPGAILIAGGVGSLAICSITATLVFSKNKRID